MSSVTSATWPWREGEGPQMGTGGQGRKEGGLDEDRRAG